MITQDITSILPGSNAIGEGFQKELNKRVERGIEHFCQALVLDLQSTIDNDAITWTGNLRESISYEIEYSTEGEIMFKLNISAPYAEYIDKGTELHFYPFYKGKGLTNLGLWAIQKLGFTESGDGNHLLNSQGKRTGGMSVNQAHPFVQFALERNLPQLRDYIIEEIAAK